MKRSPIVLIIRDGWGVNHNPAHDTFNAIKLAHTPCADKLSRNWPRTEIAAHGLDVGLPDGVMGNSEVGHQNIGAGRIVDQEIVRISKAFNEGTIRQNPVLQKAFERIRRGGRLHLVGLVSDAGVHSLLEHLYALLDLAAEKGLSEVYIHAFTDGRDTPPFSGLGYIRELEAHCKRLGVGRIASVCGRYWSMDRDQRWPRTQKAYDALSGRRAESTAPDAETAVQQYYDHPAGASLKGDEFIPPTWILDEKGEPLASVAGGDSVIFYNFRGDRPRQIPRAFISDSFDGFEREPIEDLYFVAMTEYEKGLCPNVLFLKPPRMKNILGQYVSERGIPQFRCAETEKYPHVTFFFNDYRDEPFPGEDRQIIPSPRDVATYDQKPEMSAHGICEATRKAILSGSYGLIVVNFANPDMVGHTGSLEAVVRACETVDSCVNDLLSAAKSVDGRAVVTADHGNADQMYAPEISGSHTAHTTNPVEVVLFGQGCEDLKLREGGRLADIAPTILSLMELGKPEEMTGQCLIC